MDDHRVMSSMGAIISAVISMVVIIVIGMIDTDSHDGEPKKIWWVITIVIWRIIRHIHRGIHILNYRRGFNHNDLCGSRFGFYRGISRIPRIGCHRWCGRFRLDDIILPIQILVSDNLHSHFAFVILGK